jgi:hypothetical protein
VTGVFKTYAMRTPPLAEIPRFLLVGFLERQRAGCPAPTEQKFPPAIGLHLHASQMTAHPYGTVACAALSVTCFE